MVDRVTRGNIWGEFMKMRIKHERLGDAHSVFDDLRAARRAAPYEPQRFASMFAPTHSGKSMSIVMYRETIVAAEAVRRGLFPADMDVKEVARRQRIVLHISLEGVTTIKNLAEEILIALGKSPPKGTTSGLLKLAYDHLQEFETELLIIDETQHLKVAKDRSKFSELREGETALTNTLKTMLIRGLVPMVFVGVLEARALLFNDEQLANRCIAEIDYRGLDFALRREREIFVKYCGRLGLKLQQHGLFRDSSNFLVDDIPACLHAASGGRIGVVSRLVEHAAVLAKDDKADAVQRVHLEKAVDGWAIPKQIVDYNPFAIGVNQAKLVRQ
ncbi:conserved hypothetical protein [Rhodopseudomonas palustris BisB5]|uniref:ORC1/DEAH AAA+ ATPase domain-containing protein n=1 Tax=Rhodopseudomonas palustris (strain BisB5) TaxID=316057 RepID=Q132V6_RHOPS|nr:conserved hypothetical protein [Rhodopseudomonas palustris BisB5]